MVIVFPLYSVRLGKYALTIAFGLGYLSHLCGFSPMWMFAFSIVIFIAPAGHFKVLLLSCSLFSSSFSFPTNYGNCFCVFLTVSR
jgi:hypothetical protein